MSALRPQYHFRKTDRGIDAWDVGRLIELSAALPVRQIDPTAVAELHQDHWYFQGGRVPSPASIIEHIRLIEACDLAFPIVLGEDGRVMDGMHRICKAILAGQSTVPAVQFQSDPEPDFANCDPDALPIPGGSAR